MYNFQELNVNLKRVVISSKMLLRILMLLQLFVYLAMAFWGESNQISDAEAYEKILRELIITRNIYPSGSQIFSNYINNPGAVNAYLLVWRTIIPGNIRILFVFNAVIIWGGNLILLHILDKLEVNYNKKISFAILSLLYLSNIGLVNTITSDVLSYFLLSLTILIVFNSLSLLKSNNIISLRFFLIGAFFAIFDYVRPIGFICMATFIIYVLILGMQLNRNRLVTSMIKCISIVILFVFTKFLIGYLHYLNTGNNIKGSISVGYNMLMGNGIDSDGSWTGGVFNEGGKGYFKNINLTSAQKKDNIWIKQSLDSIIKEPTNFVKLGLRKVLLTYSYDLLALEKLTTKNLSQLSFNTILNFRDHCFWDKFVILLNNIIFWILILNFIVRIILLVFNFDRLIWPSPIIFLYLLVFLYSLVIFIVIGGARYHHVVMPVFFIVTYLGDNSSVINISNGKSISS
jgi:hypothetical protein